MDNLGFYFKKKDKQTGETIAFNEQDKLLIGLAIKGAMEKVPSIYKEWTKELNDRLNYELEIIINMGFSSYFLIVQDFLNFGRKCGHMKANEFDELRNSMSDMSAKEMLDYVEARQTEPGMTIGLGRGSGAGSLVCFLIGITGLDPIKNGLLFERFLNPKRVSMPDIDSDLSKAEFDYGVRDLTIEYVKKKYGAAGICGITTPNTLAARAAIENVARAAGWEELVKRGVDAKSEEGTVIKKKYLALGDRIKKFIPDAPGTEFFKAGDSDDMTVDEKLRQEFADDAEALNIIDVAESVEGANINFGKHACGIIISDNGDVGAYAPLMMDTKANQLKIQLNAEQAESSGLLKMDFLGLKTLNILTKTLRLVYQHTGKYIDLLKDVDLEDKRVYAEIYSKAKTNDVFQFESPGMKSMLKRFEPESFADIVLLVACFRPGPIQYLDGIIDRKHGRKAGENAVTRIASYYKPFADIVNPTYMALVYQEQIMNVFRMVGYDMGGADNVRRAMGHKKMDVLVAEKQNFVYGCPEKNIQGAVACGIKEEDALDLFEEMIEFAKYSFNKSHAAAYAETSYYTAWFKLYYPAEFYAAVMGFLPIEKIPPMISEGKSIGLTFHGPDINKSENSATGEGSDVYLGFSGIKGIGGIDVSMRPFQSISDFVIRSGAGNKIIDSLIDVGAFDSMCKNRAAIKNVTPDMYALRKKLTEREKKQNIDEQIRYDLTNGIALDRQKYKITTKTLPTLKKVEERMEKRSLEMAKYIQEIKSIVIPVTEVKEDLETKLAIEHELLGMYVSGHPLDPYGIASDFGCTSISDTLPDESGDSQRLFGLITNLSIKSRKKDGKSLAFFDLEDQTGSVHVSCFTKQFEMYKDQIREGAAVILVGSLKANTDDEQSGDEDAEVTYEFIISGRRTDAVHAIGHSKSTYTLSYNGIEELEPIIANLTRFAEDYGHKVILFDNVTKEFGTLTTRVSTEAFTMSGLNLCEE